MKKHHILLAAVTMLFVSSVYGVFAQLSTSSGSMALEQQYEEQISAALKLQVQADSLSRAANLKRRELAFSGNQSGRSELENQIITLEDESRLTQNRADSLYSQARATELRIIAGRRSAEPVQSASNAHEQASESYPIRNSGNSQIDNREGNQRPSADIQQAPPFLELGGKDIANYLSGRELALATELEPQYERANLIMWEVSDKTDEMEQLGYIIDSDPPRREKRRINRRLDELAEEVFEMKMEAMGIYERVNEIRYSAATRFLEERRSEVNDSLIIRSGLKYEEFAGESFRQAAGLRQSAADMRSDKYREGFILRAYTEELKAFKELENALEIYNIPSVAERTTTREVPLRADGRLDPGMALSRARNVASEAAPNRTGTEVDFGFSVLPETPYSSQNPVPSNIVLPMGMVYSIQLGIFNTVMTPGSFGGLYPVMSEREPGNGSVRYYTGVFRSISDAEKALVQVNSHGFSDAFLIAYNDGIRMPVSRARQLERTAGLTGGNAGQTEITGPASRNVDRQGAGVQNNGTPELEKASVVTFRIQLGALSRPADRNVFNRWQQLAGVKKVDYTRNNNGLYIYSTGNFNTFEEAVRKRDLFKENGVADAYIIPYRDDLRINMEEADQLIRNR